MSAGGAGIGLRVWRELATPRRARLVEMAIRSEGHDVRGVEALRAECADAEVVRAALEVAAARRKAGVKFGDRASAMWCDVQGVEMASSIVAARYKAGRLLGEREGLTVADLCCGIGGDAMALSERGARVVGVDRDETRVWMCEQNAGANGVCASVEESLELASEAGAFHLDPSRRSDSGSRRHRYSELTPGPDVIERVIERSKASGRGGCVKLGPGTDITELPRLDGGEVEVLSERGQLTQMLLWTGPSAAGGERGAGGGARRRATLLDKGPDGGVLGSVAGGGDEPVERCEVARQIYEVDASVERVGLLGAFGQHMGMGMPHERLGLYSSDRVVDHPMLTRFELIADMAWNQKKVKAELARFCAGLVEVKTRGGAVNPDVVQEQLRGSGSERLTVFVLRFDRAIRCLIARRMIGA